MPARGISKAWEDEILKTWEEMGHPPATKVHDVFVQSTTHGRRQISLRKVQAIITNAKRDVSRRPISDYPREFWKPWRDESEDSEESLQLMQLDAVSKNLMNRPLYIHEARWARKLRILMDGLSPKVQFLFVRAYGTAAEVAWVRGEDVAAPILDLILLYRPWEAGNQPYLDAAAYQQFPAFEVIHDFLPEQLLFLDSNPIREGSAYVHYLATTVGQSSTDTLWKRAFEFFDTIVPSMVSHHSDKSEEQLLILDSLSLFWSADAGGVDNDSFMKALYQLIARESDEEIAPIRDAIDAKDAIYRSPGDRHKEES